MKPIYFYTSLQNIKGDGTMRSVFLELFTEPKPVIGVVHLKGTGLEDVVRHAKKEIEVYLKQDIDGILFADDSGKYEQLELVLDYIRGLNVRCAVGVHVVHVDALSFHLANKFSLEFVQVDAFTSPVNARDEYAMHVFFDLYRENCDAKVIGAVRSGQLPHVSARTIEEDLDLAMARCDTIAVHCQGRNERAEERIHWFAQTITSVPLILCETTGSNLLKYIDCWDAAMLDGSIKDDNKQNDKINEDDVKQVMEQVRTYRATIAHSISHPTG